jgi:hypothetical protein
MNKYSTLLLFLFLCFSRIEAQSICQQVISSLGTNTTTPQGLSLSFTIGEPVSKALSASGTTLTQGFHQPELCLLTPIHAVSQSPAFQLEIYPNPVQNDLSLQFSEVLSHTLIVQVTNLSGAVLTQQNIPKSSDQALIQTQLWPDGIYYLSLHSEAGHVLFVTPVVKMKP